MLEIHCFIYIILERKGEGAEKEGGGERGGRKEVERLVWKYFLNEFIKIIYNVLKFFSIFFYYINLYFFWNICNFIFLE